jgi:hypothetical protein
MGVSATQFSRHLSSNPSGRSSSWQHPDSPVQSVKFKKERQREGGGWRREFDRKKVLYVPGMNIEIAACLGLKEKHCGGAGGVRHNYIRIAVLLPMSTSHPRLNGLKR